MRIQYSGCMDVSRRMPTWPDWNAHIGIPQLDIQRTTIHCQRNKGKAPKPITLTPEETKASFETSFFVVLCMFGANHRRLYGVEIVRTYSRNNRRVFQELGAFQWDPDDG